MFPLKATRTDEAVLVLFKTQAVLSSGPSSKFPPSMVGMLQWTHCGWKTEAFTNGSRAVSKRKQSLVNESNNQPHPEIAKTHNTTPRSKHRLTQRNFFNN